MTNATQEPSVSGIALTVGEMVERLRQAAYDAGYSAGVADASLIETAATLTIARAPE